MADPSKEVREYWDRLGGAFGEQAAIDPRDRRGLKNRYIAYCRDLALLPMLEAGDRLLDIGCGTGTFLSRIRAMRSLDVACGVDVSHSMLKQAVALDASLYGSLVRTDGVHLPFCDAAFSVVTLAGVLLYLRDDDSLTCALREMHRVLEPNGRLLAVEQVRATDRHDLVNMKLQRAPSTLMAALSRSGFSAEWRQIRRGHFPLVYLIRYGLMPARLMAKIAALERQLWGAAALPRHDYADALIIARRLS